MSIDVSLKVQMITVVDAMVGTSIITRMVDLLSGQKDGLIKFVGVVTTLFNMAAGAHVPSLFYLS